MHAEKWVIPRFHRREDAMKRFAVAAICAVFVLVCAPPRARAQSFFGGLPIDTIHCEAMEGAVEHLHSHLQLFDRGQPVSIPAGVGIPQGGSCLYWVHTHNNDGIIHIESPNTHPFTLGQFFDIWGMSLDAGHAAGVKAPFTGLNISADDRTDAPSVPPATRTLPAAASSASVNFSTSASRALASA